MAPVIALASALAPVATVAAAGVGIAGAMGAFDRGGGAKPAGVPERKVTAEPTLQLSEAAKKKRRLDASSLTRDFGEPTLGIPALLG